MSERPLPRTDNPVSADATMHSASRPVPPLNVNLRGALWMLLAALGFACMAALVKLLGMSGLDSMQIVFFRAVVGLIAILPFLAWAGWSMAVPQYPMRHLYRASTGLVALVCGFYAFTHLPLATATAISFAQPLFMTVLAVLFLGEVVRWRRWTATLVGFAGVLVILRPGADSLQFASLAALGNAVFLAATAAQVKAMPGQERDLTLLFTSALFSTVALIIPAVLVWQTPTPWQTVLLVATGLLGVSSQAAAIRAYRVGAEASFVAPFDYIRLLAATVFGIMLFAEVPDMWTGAGAALIVASTLYIARRDAMRRARGRSPAPGGRQ